MPKRIQRKRTKGYKLPDNTLCVTRPSKWANPFKIGDKIRVEKTGKIIVIDRYVAIQLYLGYIIDKISNGEVDLAELRQYDYLACYCPIDKICHVDILLYLLEK